MVDNGNGDFNFDFIDSGTFMMKQYLLINIDTTLHQPKVIVQEYSAYKRHLTNNTVPDTLVIKYNGFVEYNKQPEHFEISKVTMSTSECFGTCPVFDLSVLADGTAFYNAKEYNKKKGNFNGLVNQVTRDELFDLINYIHPISLNNSYKVGWTDDQTINLTIIYRDGTVKSISDYGVVGTLGLQRLYGNIYRIRNTLKWQKDK